MIIAVQLENMERLLAGLDNGSKIVEQAMHSAFGRAGKTLRTYINRGVKRESYFKNHILQQAINKPELEAGAVNVLVNSRIMPAHYFRLFPNKITARKGKRSTSWKEPGFRVAPGLRVRYAERSNDKSKGFIFHSKYSGRLVLGQRGWGKSEKNRKVIRTVYGTTVQYFAVFDEVAQPALEAGKETFEKRLLHEIDYRLGLGK